MWMAERLLIRYCQSLNANVAAIKSTPESSHEGYPESSHERHGVSNLKELESLLTVNKKAQMCSPN